MTREEVIALLEQERDGHRSSAERLDRAIVSLKTAPAGRPAPPLPVRDEQGYAPDEPEPPRSQRPPSPQRHDGDFIDFDAETLDVGYDNGRWHYKVKGGAFKKWGVFVWPEVLVSQFEINPEELSPGMYPFKYKVRAQVVDGKPRKVIGLA